MKNIVAALATGLTILSLGMPSSAAAQDSTSGGDRRTVATPRRMAAEVLTVNRAAQALTVKTVINGKDTDAIFSVQEAAASVLDILEPGDRVIVTYVRVNDQLRAQRIVRTQEARQQR
jgi:hypothetical protein